MAPAWGRMVPAELEEGSWLVEGRLLLSDCWLDSSMSPWDTTASADTSAPGLERTKCSSHYVYNDLHTVISQFFSKPGNIVLWFTEWKERFTFQGPFIRDMCKINSKRATSLCSTITSRIDKLLRGVRLTYQCPALERRHPSPPLYRQLLAPPGPEWMCSPWEQTERRALLCQTEPLLRRQSLKHKEMKDTFLETWSAPNPRFPQLPRTQIWGCWRKDEAERLNKLLSSHQTDRDTQIPGAATCSGVVGTLRPPDSSSWGAKNRGLSYIPRPEEYKDLAVKEKRWWNILIVKVLIKRGEAPPCDASCPRSECEEELVCGMSSEGPNLKRGTPATCGELRNTNMNHKAGVT